jgi:hypothetical protein
MLGYFPVLNAATFLSPNFKELFNDAIACIIDLLFDLNHFKLNFERTSFISHFRNGAQR